MSLTLSDGDLLAAKFYFSKGACCAGCDWWQRINSVAGWCLRTAPVEGTQRVGLFGIESCSLPIPAGHILTPRNHLCGEFKDTFDWTALPLSTRRLVGAP